MNTSLIDAPTRKRDVNRVLTEFLNSDPAFQHFSLFIDRFRNRLLGRVNCLAIGPAFFRRELSDLFELAGYGSPPAELFDAQRFQFSTGLDFFDNGQRIVDFFRQNLCGMTIFQLYVRCYKKGKGQMPFPDIRRSAKTGRYPP